MPNLSRAVPAWNHILETHPQYFPQITSAETAPAALRNGAIPHSLSAAFEHSHDGKTDSNEANCNSDCKGV